MDWRERERQKFIDGTYKKVPWFEKGLIEETEDHFLHFSEEDPRLLAYTRNVDCGQRNIQTRIKPGKYLSQFYSYLSPTIIRDMVHMISAHGRELKFAVTANEIVEVYTNGPDSCMAHSEDNYAGHIHPVSVYGDSDLQLAYYKNDAGEITARCLVWPEKKKYLRTPYGEDYMDLIFLLEEHGFTRSEAFVGAKINLIYDENNESSVIMPYIDGTNAVKIRPNQNCAVIASEKSFVAFDANDTRGTLDIITSCAVSGTRGVNIPVYDIFCSMKYVSPKHFKKNVLKCDLGIANGRITSNSLFLKNAFMDKDYLWVFEKGFITNISTKYKNVSRPMFNNIYYTCNVTGLGLLIDDFYDSNYKQYVNIGTVGRNKWVPGTTSKECYYVYDEQKTKTDLAMTTKKVLEYLNIKFNESEYSPTYGLPFDSSVWQSIANELRELRNKNKSKLDINRAYTFTEFMDILYSEHSYKNRKITEEVNDDKSEKLLNFLETAPFVRHTSVKYYSTDNFVDANFITGI